MIWSKMVAKGKRYKDTTCKSILLIRRRLIHSAHPNSRQVNGIHPAHLQYTAGGGDGYTLHVNTKGTVDGYC